MVKNRWAQKVKVECFIAWLFCLYVRRYGLCFPDVGGYGASPRFFGHSLVVFRSSLIILPCVRLAVLVLAALGGFDAILLKFPQ